MIHKVKLSNNKVLRVEEQNATLLLATEENDGSAGWYLCEITPTKVTACQSINMNPANSASLPCLLKDIGSKPKYTAPPIPPKLVPVADFFKSVQICCPGTVSIAQCTPTMTSLTSNDGVVSTLKDHAPVDWGGLEVYPAPAGKWMPVRGLVQDWGRLARFRASTNEPWRNHNNSGEPFRLSGLSTIENKWMTQFGSVYNYCEVWVED